jgi:hypothetical protein
VRVIGEIRTPTVLLSREQSSIDHLFVVAVQRLFMEWKIVWHVSLDMFNMQTARATNVRNS